MNVILSAFLFAVTMAGAQRPPYAGSKPIGYPELADRFTSPEDPTSTAATSLDNRFGENGQTTPSTTTIRLPVDALGDKDLVDRISKWPVEKQPFWYVNWQLIEAHRQQKPTIQEPSPVGPQQPSSSAPQQISGQPPAIIPPRISDRPSTNVPQQNSGQSPVQRPPQNSGQPSTNLPSHNSVQSSTNLPQQNSGQLSANVPQQNSGRPQKPINTNQPTKINQHGRPQREA